MVVTLTLVYNIYKLANITSIRSTESGTKITVKQCLHWSHANTNINSKGAVTKLGKYVRSLPNKAPIYKVKKHLAEKQANYLRQKYKMTINPKTMGEKPAGFTECKT